MSYLQGIFKFLLVSSKELNKVSPIDIRDYLVFLPEEGFKTTPYPKPTASSNYFDELEIWEKKCVMNEECRNELKEFILNDINKIVLHINSSKEIHKDESFVTSSHYNYNFFHKNYIDSWIEIWENLNPNLESIETLILFKKVLSEICQDNRAIQLDIYKRNEQWNENTRDAKREQKYWTDNYYSEGGGNQNWSDPFD